MPNSLQDISDTVSRDRIENLHPDAMQVFIDAFVEMQALYPDLRITDAYRTIQEQNDLYNIGRGEDDDRSVVTNARGGSSYHNYGLAIDVVRVTDGQANYEGTSYEDLADICEKYGLEWGGNWDSFPDQPHFQITYGFSIDELYQKYQNGEVDENGYVILE